MVTTPFRWTIPATTYSDEPGHDTLESLAMALNASWQAQRFLSLEALLSRVDADTRYGYDEDWSYPGICDGTACDSDLWGFDWWYTSTDNYVRNNNNTTADIRLVSDSGAEEAAWVAGIYHRNQDQSLLREYTYASGDFDSRLRHRKPGRLWSTRPAAGPRLDLHRGSAL